jgi:hypothetical protein
MRPSIFNQACSNNEAEVSGNYFSPRALIGVNPELGIKPSDFICGKLIGLPSANTEH